MRSLLALTVFMILGNAPAAANDDEQLIEALLSSVGTSECTFIRNGKEYDADEAEDHLRMKYRRGKKYVSGVDTFIKRIATKSSMSGKPYMIRCNDTEAVPTAEWLAKQLEAIQARVD